MPTSPTRIVRKPRPESATPNELLKAKAKPDIVEVPARKVIARFGAGGPALEAFSRAVGALYGVAYTMKFARKETGGADHKVGVLEGEWSAEGADLSLHEVPDPDTWRWRIQLAVPDDTTTQELRAAIEAATTRRGGKLKGSDEATRVELVSKSARRFGRILHKGPFATEPGSFEKIGTLLKENGLTREPWHVEVYLSDPRRTAPEKQKTTLLAPIN